MQDEMTIALDALHLSQQLESDIAEQRLQLQARQGIAREFDPNFSEYSSEWQTTLEQLRGKEILLKHQNAAFVSTAHTQLSRTFNPDHVDAGVEQAISPEERARRDAYRKNYIKNWSVD